MRVKVQQLDLARLVTVWWEGQTLMANQMSCDDKLWWLKCLSVRKEKGRAIGEVVVCKARATVSAVQME